MWQSFDTDFRGKPENDIKNTSLKKPARDSSWLFCFLHLFQFKTKKLPKPTRNDSENVFKSIKVLFLLYISF
ncbi:MAG TPA: hypothetical protein DD629_04010 [Treponema sp.]|nr:hypothetical protein [Treponema sp.]